MAAMSPSRRVAVVVVALIVVVDLVVIGWWLLGRSGDGSGVEDGATDPNGQTIDGPGLGRGLSALVGAPGSDADVIASMDDGSCHLVALGSFPTLSGARDFASDPATPELLADRSRVVPSTALPGFGPDGYVVVALGENPGDAARLADVASDTGLEVTPPTSLEQACPAAAT